MLKEEYREPTVIIIQLQHQNQLLNGSTGLNHYYWHQEEEE